MSWLALAVLCAPPQDPVVLIPGVPHRAKLHTLTDFRHDFAFEVPPDSVFLEVRAVARQGDIDLFGGQGDAPEDVYDGAFQADSDLGVEELIVDRFSLPPIANDIWWFSVVSPDEGPFGNGDPFDPRREYTIELRVLGTRTDLVLVPGETVRQSLDPKLGGFRTFRIDVPEGAKALRIDLHDVPGNLDLYARRGAPITALETAMARARHDWGAETLLFTPATRPALRPGTWYVDVVDSVSSKARTPFEIRAAFDETPYGPWTTPPLLAMREGDKQPLARALCSVLEVFAIEGSASGTLVTPDGLVITNAHVVDRGDGQPVAEVVLAASLDPRLPAVECFRGSVLRFDAELDLALLQVDRGFYGTPLPADYRFPTVAMRFEPELEIGDPL